MIRLNTPTWIWKLLRFFNIGAEKRLHKNLQTCDTFIYSLIQTRRDKVAKGLNLGEDIDLLSRCMDVSDSEVLKDDVYLRDMVINFLIAGRDTTACALSWLFYELALNPDVEKQLREEIDVSLSGSVPNYDNIKDMPYLQACLSETQRLHPSVPYDGKTALADDILPSGHKVPRGAQLAFNNYAMGRDEEYWAPDALVFRPSRWLDKSGLYEKVDPFKFPAFQAGPRLFLGIDMAHLEMKITTILLLQKFRFRLCAGQNITYRLTLVLQMKNPLMMTAEVI